jgi:hypothetical protein
MLHRAELIYASKVVKQWRADDSPRILLTCVKIFCCRTYNIDNKNRDENPRTALELDTLYSLSLAAEICALLP